MPSIIGSKFNIMHNGSNYKAHVVQYTPPSNKPGFFTLLIYRPLEARQKAYVVTVDEKKITGIIKDPQSLKFAI